ncbi:MAG: DUF4404 family protein [Pirellulaceae bacterium]|nr:DUF4404 family protein [Pirellulaceae bacterium]
MHAELLETLKSLHLQLESIDDLDETEVELLQKSVTEIQETLEEKDVDSASLAKRFHEATESFRESHPVLTRTAGQFADMLSQMGI